MTAWDACCTSPPGLHDRGGAGGLRHNMRKRDDAGSVVLDNSQRLHERQYGSGWDCCTKVGYVTRNDNHAGQPTAVDHAQAVVGSADQTGRHKCACSVPIASRKGSPRECARSSLTTRSRPGAEALLALL